MTGVHGISVPKVASATDTETSVGGGAGVVVDIASRLPRVDRRDPNEALKDLELPSSIADVIRPPLEAAGSVFRTYEFRDVGDTARRMNEVLQNNVQLFLMHIAAWILDDAGGGNLQAVGSLGWSLPRSRTVHLWSEEAADFAFPYQRLFEQWRKERQLLVNFVPWRYVRELRDKDVETRRRMLLTLLGLSEGVGGLDLSAALDQLKQKTHVLDELQELMVEAAVSQFGVLGPAAFFKSTVDRANIPDKWKAETANAWTNTTPPDMAKYLVTWCMAKRQNTIDIRYSVLASICVELLDRVGLEEQRFIIASLIDECALVSDKMIVAELRDRYLGT